MSATAAQYDNMSARQIESELIEHIASFHDDPLGFVIFAFPWTTNTSIQTVKLPDQYQSRYNTEYGPDLWSCMFLDDLGNQIKQNKFNGTIAVPPIRMAVTSGHGVGKSTLTAWITNFIMSTRPESKGTITANTNAQLETKTWAEIAKWTRLSIVSHWFKVSTGRGSMKMSHVDAPEKWFCTAQTCREENSESFAGQHAANSTSFYIFDEASAIPNKIFEVSEGGLTDGEPMAFAFGNPTRNSGYFHSFFHGSLKHRWNTRHVDSREVQITNKAQIQEWIDDYGVDSDFVKVRVRGLFPNQSIKQFISSEYVDAAYGRELRKEQFDFAPKILTCDPAFEGDDILAIGMRQGLLFKVLRKIPKNDNDIQIANILAHLEDEHRVDAVFIDGGFGTGIVSAGRTLNRNWRIVWFAEKSADAGCINKRAEMWKKMRDWLKEGGCIPQDPELSAELTSIETVPRLDDKIQLESKKDMKKRGLPSPNIADCLALTFAYPVHKKANALSSSPAASREKADRHKGHDPFRAVL